MKFFSKKICKHAVMLHYHAVIVVIIDLIEEIGMVVF